MPTRAALALALSCAALDATAAWPGLRGALPDRSDAPVAALPDRSDAPVATALPVPPTLAASALAAAPSDPDADAAETAAAERRAADCAATLRLPWGPLDTCRDAIVIGSISATAVGGFAAWWNRGFDTRLDIANEGWFGDDTYSGGIDKLGHGFSFYVGTRLMNRALGWAGVPHGESLPLATALSLGLGLGVEVLDGLARGGKYGFSWQDLVIDVAGTGLAVLAESDAGFDRRFAVRWLRADVPDARRGYDRHRYFAVMRPSGFDAVGPSNPLRWLELMVGYGATGFAGDEEGIPSPDRRRSLYVGVGIDVTQVLERTAFRDGRAPRTRAFATELLRYVQLPGTVATTAVRTWRP